MAGVELNRTMLLSSVTVALTFIAFSFIICSPYRPRPTHVDYDHY